MNSATTPAPAQPGQEGRPLRAAAHGLVTCERCGLLARMPDSRAATQAVLTREYAPDDTAAAPVCPRCMSPMHVRKPDSLARCWALLIAAAAMYLPANLLPVMITDTLLGTQQDTIMSGIVYLWTSGSWHLAIIVFIASFLVPLAKLGIWRCCAFRCSNAGAGTRDCARACMRWSKSSAVGRCSMYLW